MTQQGHLAEARQIPKLVARMNHATSKPRNNKALGWITALSKYEYLCGAGSTATKGSACIVGGIAIEPSFERLGRGPNYTRSKGADARWDQARRRPPRTASGQRRSSRALNPMAEIDTRADLGCLVTGVKSTHVWFCIPLPNYGRSKRQLEDASGRSASVLCSGSIHRWTSSWRGVKRGG